MCALRALLFDSHLTCSPLRATQQGRHVTRQADGAALTAEARQTREKDIEETASFEREVRARSQVLPNVPFRDTLIFWSGSREFRLMSATGDATASTVLYLPAEKVLVTGDVLVAPESGEGPPP